MNIKKKRKQNSLKWNLLESSATIHPPPSFYGRPLFQPPARKMMSFEHFFAVKLHALFKH